MNSSEQLLYWKLETARDPRILTHHTTSRAPRSCKNSAWPSHPRTPPPPAPHVAAVITVICQCHSLYERPCPLHELSEAELGAVQSSRGSAGPRYVPVLHFHQFSHSQNVVFILHCEGIFQSSIPIVDWCEISYRFLNLCLMFTFSVSLVCNQNGC